MSTRSNIGIINQDGTVEVIYCHWDGYPSFNGALLLNHYKDEAKVRKLLQLGDISSLAENPEPAAGAEHNFDNPAENVVVAYMRDRGEKDLQARHIDSLDEYLALVRNDVFIEFVYLFNAATGTWQWMPNFDDGSGCRDLRLLKDSDVVAPQAA